MFPAPTHHTLSAVWERTRGDERIRIAVLDGPVDRAHSAFQGAKLANVSEGPSVAGISPGIATEHGTHIASLIFGQHGSPIKGIAPRCSGLLVPIFADSPSGALLKCSQADLANAVITAVEQGANIVNISGGEFTSSGRADAVLASALERCDREGVLIVAAAGNEGCDCLHIPAAHPCVLAVGAATAAGEPRESSNWGSQYQGHGILAPGENVRGALPGGKVAERSGTSTATAIVSGVAGLLMSLDLQRGVAPNGPRIRRLLMESADPCPQLLPSTCRRYLSGVLNVDRAVSLISKKDIKMSVNDPSTHLQSNSPLWEEKNPTGANARSHLALQPPGMPTNALGASCGAPPVQLAGDVVPSGCGCGGPSPNAQPVFAFGKVGYGFNSQARFDSFWQHMYDNKNRSPNPYDVDQFLAYLQKNPWDATSVTWTLTLESVPVYAISVAGPNSTYVVDFLKKSLHEQQDDIDIIDRVSIAGVLGGRVTLMTGEQLPVIHPELRGTSSFKIDDLVDHAAGKLSGEGKARQKLATKRDALSQFVDRVYFGPLNFGLAPRDRAINYVATNLFSLEKALDEEHQKIQFHSVDAQPSVVSRTGSDCWDVKLEYFFTDDKTGTARRLFRITVDVSDVVPVTVGKPRYWLSGD